MTPDFRAGLHTESRTVLLRLIGNIAALPGVSCVDHQRLARRHCPLGNIKYYSDVAILLGIQHCRRISLAVSGLGGDGEGEILHRQRYPTEVLCPYSFGVEV